MGNFISKIDKSLDRIYDSYYPKQRYLQPLYIESVGLLAIVGRQLLQKQAIKDTPKDDLLYLGALSTLVGTQFWNFFISGKTLFDTLPRIQYARAESRLYPKYGAVATLLSGVAAFAYLKRYPFSTWNERNCTFGWCVLASFVFNIFNTTCFTQQTFKVYNQIIEIEKAAGANDSVVGFFESPLLEKDEAYKKLRCRFQLLHGLIATSGFVSFGCSVAQIYLLCSQSIFRF